MERLIRLAISERGQDMVEYAMISMLISVAIVLAALIIDIPGAFEAWATTICNEIAPDTC